MERIRRLRFYIIAALVCAVLLCIATFSISFAKWSNGDDSSPTADVKGESSLFYVEYPQYVTADGVAIPVLEKDTYYIQVPRKDNANVSDYYAMWENDEKKNTESAEKMITSVRLYDGNEVSLYKGTEKVTLNHNTYSTPKITFSNGSYTVNEAGYFDFYYAYNHYNNSDNKMYVGYAGALNTGNTGNTGDNTTVAPERDTSKNSVKIKFSDATIVFELGDHANGDGDTYFHIWKKNNAQDDTNETTLWPGLIMSTGDDNQYATGNSTKEYNSIKFNFSYKDVGGIILNLNDGDNHRTGDGDTFYRAAFGSALNPDCTYTINAINNAHWNDFNIHGSFDWLKSKFSVEEKSAGSTPTTPTTPITPAKPTTTGATTFSADSQKKNEKIETVRVMNATMTKQEDGTYEYHNYICVSRPNADDSADDNSIAIIEFEIESTDGKDLSKIPVSSITLTRRDTDNEGNPVNGYITPAPRVYNYDLTNTVYLSDIGHGEKHSNFSEDADLKNKNTENMIPHYDDGMYVILYFADKKQQYFALDLSIVTTKSASFTLKAKVNNTNMWDRYKEGFGEEWGYYMGGLINDVWMWNPTRTTKFDATSGTVKFDEGKEKNYLKDNSIADLNDDPDFNYNIVDYSNGGTVLDEDGKPMYARYSTDYVDISLTINLTAGSKIKLSMLDGSGQRGDIGNGLMRPTTYYLPNKIISSPENLFAGADNYDKDLNFVVPATGEYSFRFVGNISDRVGQWMKKSDGSISSTKPSESVLSQYVQIPEYNFVIDKLYISQASEVGKMNIVTFDANGGTFNDNAQAVAEQKVRFGNIAVLDKDKDGNYKAPQPEDITPPTDRVFAGWYYIGKDDDGNTANIDYKGTPVLADMTLYAKWVGMEYEVTFDLNAPTGVTPTLTGSQKLTTNNSGTLEGKTLPTASATGYTFDGWYLEQTDPTTKVDATTTFTANTTVYAKWSLNKYNVTFNLNGLPTTVFTAPATQKVEHNKPAEDPNFTIDTDKTGYTFVGWYTNTAGTGTAYDFDTEVTAAVSLYAKWTAEDGVYVNDLYVTDLKDNGSSGDRVKLKVEGLLLMKGDTVKFRNDGAQIGKATMFVRQDSVNSASGNVTDNNNGSFTVKNNDNYSGWYNLYYDSKDTIGEKGVWVAFAHKYAASEFDEAHDGLYVGDVSVIDNRISAFTVNDSTSYELKATVTLNASTAITLVYANTAQTSLTIKTAEGSLGTFKNGKVELGAGTYTFYYDYIDNKLYIEGKYPITFNADGGTFANGESTATALTGKVENGSATLAEGDIPADPTRDKYEFKGWVTTQGGNTAIPSTFSAATTVYAKWEQVQFDVTFDFNGNVAGSTPTTTVTTGKTADGKLTADQFPTDPTRAGYAFGGWYTTNDHNASVKVDTNTEFTADATVYAKWQYTVTFNAGTGASWGDGSNPHTQNVNIGGHATAISAPENNPDGKSFAGWYTAESSGSKFDFGTAINSNVTLYAQWSTDVVTYTITFDANDGTCATASATTKADGTLDLAELPTPTLTNCGFDGWYTSGGSKVTLSTVFTSGQTVTARWNVTITFNLNYTGATGAPESQTIARGTSLDSLPEPTRDYYTRNGWYTLTSGGTQITTATTFNANQTIYAHWTIMANGLYVNGTTKKASWTANGSGEVMALAVVLNANDKIGVIYGGAVVAYANNTYSTNKVTYSNGAYTTNAAFAFDFYLKTDSSHVLYVSSRYVKITGTDSKSVYITVSDKDTVEGGRDLGDVFVYGYATDGAWPGKQLTNNGDSFTIDGTLSNLKIILNNKGSGGNQETPSYAKPTSSSSWVDGGVYQAVVKWNDNWGGGGATFTKLN